jgi:FKBP-type peptidyl-prolyl cis-trans isomerase SlyD
VWGSVLAALLPAHNPKQFICASLVSGIAPGNGFHVRIRSVGENWYGKQRIPSNLRWRSDMNEPMNTENTVKDDSVVSLDYTLKVDNQVVDSSDENEPIQFIQGLGQIIPGLEKELYGMNVGDSKSVVVKPQEGYGDIDDEAYAEVPKSEFPPNIPLEKGIALSMQDENGETVTAYIDEVKDNTVLLDFNHPLAGKELHFSVTVVEVRDATEDELSHGHVHNEDGEEWEEEDWDDEEDWEEEDEEDWEDDEDEEGEEDIEDVL